MNRLGADTEEEGRRGGFLLGRRGEADGEAWGHNERTCLYKFPDSHFCTSVTEGLQSARKALLHKFNMFPRSGGTLRG